MAYTGPSAVTESITPPRIRSIKEQSINISCCIKGDVKITYKQILIEAMDGMVKYSHPSTNDKVLTVFSR